MAARTLLMGAVMHTALTEETVSNLPSHLSALRAAALRLSKNEAEADDLLQDTLERALGAMHTFRPGANERAWLMSILNNLFLDRCRRQARQGTRVELEADGLAEAPRDPEAPWARLCSTEIGRAIDRLDPLFREPYQRHAAGESYEEISAALRIPRATVGTRLLRARRQLRRLLVTCL